MSLSTILIFFVILLVLVIVHEFGHFIVAKWTNMRVDEFAFGFPPRLWSKRKGETNYIVNALPLGGYVSIWGENGAPNDEARHHPRAFSNRPKWAQLLVLLAGVTMNMLLAWIVFMAISYGNVQISTDDPLYGSRVKNAVLVVVDAAPESPAYKAGIVPGSTLLKVSSGKAVADLSTATSLVQFIGNHNDLPFTITYMTTEGSVVNTTVASVYGIVPDKKALGISIDKIGQIKTTPWEAVKIGSERTYDVTRLTLQGIWMVLSSVGKGENILSSLSGPVGIAKVVGQAQEYGYVAVLTLVAVLSINLAIFNALPLPALDGGRVVVVILEALIRRRIKHAYYAWINVAGFLALMLLLVVVTVSDLHK